MRLSTRLLRAVPPPSYLSMNGAGIDIGVGSVKSVIFAERHGLCEVGSYYNSELADGVIVDGDIEKPDNLVEVLRSLRLREHVRFAHASLPEKKAYLYQAPIPSVEKSLRSAVEFSLESHVPIPPNDVVFDFNVVRKTEEGVVVSVSAYAKRVVEMYQNVFVRAGIVLRSLEIESQAIGRAVLTPPHRGSTIMIVDFGRKTTRIAIFDNGAVGFTSTIDVGGETLTSAAMKYFAVSAEEAETIKNEKGFLEGSKNRELYEALMITVSVLKDEIARHIAYWETSPEEGITRKPVEQLILVGGNANLKGLPEYLSRALGFPVRVGNPWANAFSLDEYIPPMTQQQSLEYTATIGLALRSCGNQSW